MVIQRELGLPLRPLEPAIQLILLLWAPQYLVTGRSSLRGSAVSLLLLRLSWWTNPLEMQPRWWILLSAAGDISQKRETHNTNLVIVSLHTARRLGTDQIQVLVSLPAATQLTLSPWKEKQQGTTHNPSQEIVLVSLTTGSYPDIIYKVHFSLQKKMADRYKFNCILEENLIPNKSLGGPYINQVHTTHSTISGKLTILT